MLLLLLLLQLRLLTEALQKSWQYSTSTSTSPSLSTVRVASHPKAAAVVLSSRLPLSLGNRHCQTSTVSSSRKRPSRTRPRTLDLVVPCGLPSPPPVRSFSHHSSYQLLVGSHSTVQHSCSHIISRNGAMLFHRLPRVAALTRFSPPLVQTSARVPPLPLRSSSRTPLRLASTQSAAHAAKHDDHDHGNGGHDDHFDPPGGWLWGERPGDKYEKEGWEPFAWFFVASWVVAVAAYTMKEDTSYVLPSCHCCGGCSIFPYCCCWRFVFLPLVGGDVYLFYRHRCCQSL